MLRDEIAGDGESVHGSLPFVRLKNDLHHPVPPRTNRLDACWKGQSKGLADQALWLSFSTITKRGRYGCLSQRPSTRTQRLTWLEIRRRRWRWKRPPKSSAVMWRRATNHQIRPSKPAASMARLSAAISRTPRKPGPHIQRLASLAIAASVGSTVSVMPRVLRFRVATPRFAQPGRPGKFRHKPAVKSPTTPCPALAPLPDQGRSPYEIQRALGLRQKQRGLRCTPSGTLWQPARGTTARSDGEMRTGLAD